MKNQSTHLLLKRLLLFVLIVIFTASASTSFATHFRYGNLTWSRVPGATNKIQFKMFLVMRHSYFAADPAYPYHIGSVVTSNLFNPGVGSNSIESFIVTAVDQANDEIQAQWTKTITYGNPGTYTAVTPSFCCRIVNPILENNPGNAGNTQHLLKTFVQVGPGFNNNNDAPVSIIPPVINFPEHTSVVTYQIPAVDPNGDALTFSLSPNGSFGNVSVQPSGLTISPTGLITWSTTNLDSGKYFYANFRVTDSKGAYSTTDFIIKITGQSMPSAFDSSSVPNGTEVETQPGDSVVLKFKVSDPDTGDTVRLYAIGNPLGSTFTVTGDSNSKEGTFTWVPADSQQGTYVIVVTSEDKKGIQTSTSFSLDVSYKPRFDYGTIANPITPGNNSVLIIKPGDTLVHPVVSYHPTPTDGVIMTVQSGLAPGMTFSPSLPFAIANPVPTTFSWAPTLNQWGLHTVIYKAEDTFYHLTAYDTIHYIVDNPPFITSNPPKYGYVGELYNYLLTATDADIPVGDVLDVEEITKPGFLAVTDNHNATFNIAGIPAVSDIGTHQITIEVADSFNHFGGSHVGNAMQVYDLIILPALDLSGVVTHVGIHGQSTGGIDITPTGGKGPYTYLWSTNATTEDISGVPAGTYWVTVTDSLGKTISDTFVVNQPDPLTIPGVVTHVTIHGQSTGAVNTTVAGGVGPYTYSWSNSATTDDLSGIPAGSYTVTVTDANGATANGTFVVNQPDPLAVTGIVTNVTTYGGNNGAINITVTGGVGPYTYSWSNSTTSEDPTGLIAGNYTVTVTDANGATTTGTFNVTQPIPPLTGTLAVSPVYTVSGQAPYTIYLGYGPQSVTLTAQGIGGVPPYTYSWSPSSTLGSPNAAVTSAAPANTTTYTVVITDALNSTVTLNKTINVVDIRCSNHHHGHCGNNGNHNHKVYVCHHTNSNSNPTNLICISVNAVPNHLSNHGDYLGKCLDIDGSKTHVSCYGGNNGSINIDVDGGVPPYSYSWSNSATTEDISGLSAGTYTVTVTDAANNTESKSFTISQPSPISISASKVHIKCYGDNDGKINLSVCGGNSPYTYSWSNNKTTQDITGLSAGTYTVTVTDDNGCTATAGYTITQPSSAMTVSGIKTNVTCKGGENGKIDLSVSGGSGPYTYSWSNGSNNSNNSNNNWWNWWNGWCNNNNNNSTYSTTQDLTGLEAGTYTVTVTDANGCLKTASFTITEPSSALVVSGNKTNVGCHGGSNGAITLNVNGGSSPYTYLWNDNATSQNRSGLSAGNYSVTVTDANGCIKTANFTITQPSAISISGSKSNIKCYGDNDGSINISVCNGNSPYTYSWSNNKSTQDISGLSAGTYTVTVTDANGCSSTATYTITQPSSALTVSGVKTNVKCKGEENGKIDLSVSGGNGPYTYSWSNGSNNSNNNNSNWWNWWNGWCNNNNNNNTYSTTQDLTGLEAGTYTVTVTDANGCQKTASFTITEPSNAVDVSGSVTNVGCGNNCNGAINITAAGGISPYTYKWNNNSTVEDRTGLCAGSYSVVVTDANGCTKSKSFTVGQGQSNMNVSISVNPNPTVSGQAQNTIFEGYGPQCVTLTANASNGGGSYSYSWYPTSGLSNSNSKNPTASPSSTKTYTVTVTDANGCQKSQNVTIKVVDVQANGNKIYVCKNGDTKKVSQYQVASYLCNGYTLGECDDECGNKGVTETFETTDLKVYPNPTTGVFAVELPDAVKGGEVLILDISGRLIERRQFLPDTKLSFDLSYAPKGTYMVQIANGTDIYKVKVNIN